MTALTELVAAVEADATLLGLGANQMHALVAPQSISPPFVVYTPVGQARDWTLNKVPNLGVLTFQVDAYALSFAQCEAIASRLATLINDYKSAEIEQVFFDDRRAMFEDDGTRVYRVSLEFSVHFRSLSP